jgi:galactosyl transferase GMA12/MNN10 family
MASKIAMTAIHTHHIKPMSDMTWEGNKVHYAKKWGYDTYVRTESTMQWHPSYEKIFFQLQILEEHPEHEWLYWSGADSIITNFNIPLETFIDDDYHIVMATDRLNINADSYVIKNSPEARAYWKHICDLAPKYNNHPSGTWEQQALIDTIAEYRHLWKFVPQRHMNSYLYREVYPQHYITGTHDYLGNDGQWQPGDFLLHWPGTPMQLRMAMIPHFMQMVIR